METRSWSFAALPFAESNEQISGSTERAFPKPQEVGKFFIATGLRFNQRKYQVREMQHLSDVEHGSLTGSGSSIAGSQAAFGAPTVHRTPTLSEFGALG